MSFSLCVWLVGTIPVGAAPIARFAAFHPCPLDSADVVLEHEIRSPGHPSAQGRLTEGFRWREFHGEDAKWRFAASGHRSVPEPVDLPVEVDAEGHPTVTPEGAKATFRWMFQRIGRGFEGVVGRTRRHSAVHGNVRYSLSSRLDVVDKKCLHLAVHGDVVVRDSSVLRVDREGGFRSDTSFCQRDQGVSLCTRVRIVSTAVVREALSTPTINWSATGLGVHEPMLRRSDSGTVYRALPPLPFQPLADDR